LNESLVKRKRIKCLPEGKKTIKVIFPNADSDIFLNRKD
jgi:hypothetical protein